MKVLDMFPEESMFWTYNGTALEELPEKIEPKRSIRISGNMKTKKMAVVLRI
jgi:hypothetical protein